MWVIIVAMAMSGQGDCKFEFVIYRGAMEGVGGEASMA